LSSSSRPSRRRCASTSTAYQAIYKKADEEQRDPTEQERLDRRGASPQALGTLKEERDLNNEQLKTLQGVEDLGRTLGPAIPSTSMSVQSEPQDRVFNGLRAAQEPR
jgi:hypothetical protein